MRHSFKVGYSFGMTSGIITTLGVIVGLNSSTSSSLVVIGGILTVAIADAFSDSLGIHMSEEAENCHTSKEVWEATFSTFFCKFVIASSFIIPVLLLELKIAVIISLFWGLTMLSFFSFTLAREQEKKSLYVVLEHLLIAVLVIIVTHLVGYWVSLTFT